MAYERLKRSLLTDIVPLTVDELRVEEGVPADRDARGRQWEPRAWSPGVLLVPGPLSGSFGSQVRFRERLPRPGRHRAHSLMVTPLLRPRVLGARKTGREWKPHKLDSKNRVRATQEASTAPRAAWQPSNQTDRVKDGAAFR